MVTLIVSASSLPSSLKIKTITSPYTSAIVAGGETHADGIWGIGTSLVVQADTDSSISSLDEAVPTPFVSATRLSMGLRCR